jgi:nitrite reductase/ring-hydroxylating ferredoxin subunit
MLNSILKIKINDLKKNFLNIREISDYKIGIYYTLENFYVFKMTCPHVGGDLCKGKINYKDSTIQCMAHGYFFSMLNGNFLKNPNIVDTLEGRLPNKYFDPNLKSNYKLTMLTNKSESDILTIYL